MVFRAVRKPVARVGVAVLDQGEPEVDVAVPPRGRRDQVGRQRVRRGDRPAHRRRGVDHEGDVDHPEITAEVGGRLGRADRLRGGVLDQARDLEQRAALNLDRRQDRHPERRGLGVAGGLDGFFPLGRASPAVPGANLPLRGIPGAGFVAVDHQPRAPPPSGGPGHEPGVPLQDRRRRDPPLRRLPSGADLEPVGVVDRLGRVEVADREVVERSTD